MEVLDEEGNEENWSGMIKMGREGERRRGKSSKAQRRKDRGKEAKEKTGKKREAEGREGIGEDGENLGCRVRG